MIKPIPIRLDYYQYCVETWSGIFKQIDFSKIDTIIDLCLGWAPKIELALLKTDFKGKLFAVDKSQNNLDIFSSILEPFNKNYQAILKKIDILEDNHFFRNQANVVLANHIIDDIILDFYIKAKGINDNNIFSDINFLKQTWVEILQKNSTIVNVFDLFKKTIVNITKKDSKVIITQYIGYQEKLYGLEKANSYCKVFLK